MPEKLHRELVSHARAKGLSGKREDAYVYGTLNKIESGTTHKHNARRLQSMRRG